MDVTKMPAPATAAARTPSAPAADRGPQSPATAAPILDRADIRPLDIPAALQILLAEVRAAFESLALTMDSTASVTLNSPPQAAHALLQMLISATPDESASVPAWNAALTRVETALQTGLDRGIDAIIVWREVAPSVIDAAKQARTLVFATLGDDLQNPLWLRPEWAGLGPRFERFWRRRRLARRYLTDPDYSSGSSDDDGEQRT
jgi:hypothetical protein